MSDTTKFEVIDRRKYKADEERDSSPVVAAEPESTPAEPQAGPRLVTTENAHEAAAEDTSVAAGLEEEPGRSCLPRRRRRKAFSRSLPMKLLHSGLKTW